MAGARARRHAPPPGASTPPSRRGNLPGTRRRTAVARPPAPDTVPNPSPSPGVRTHQVAPGRGAAPAAGAGGGGGGTWRGRREREREGRGVRFLGFLEGQLWESFEVWWCPSWNQGWIRLLPVLWIGRYTVYPGVFCI